MCFANKKDFIQNMNRKINFHIDTLIEKTFEPEIKNKIVSLICAKSESNNKFFIKMIYGTKEHDNIKAIVKNASTFESFHSALISSYKTDVFYRTIQGNKDECLFIFSKQNNFNTLIKTTLNNYFKYIIDEVLYGDEPLKESMSVLFENTVRAYINYMTSNSLNVIESLSQYKYEKKVNKGYLSFYDDDTNKADTPEANKIPSITLNFLDISDFDNSNIRYIRKLIEGSCESIYLTIHKNKVIGYNRPDDSAVKVEFRGSNWRYFDKTLGKNFYIEYKNGHLSYKKIEQSLVGKVNENKLSQIFNGNRTAYEAFLDILETLIQDNQHGALFIITSQDKAEEESNRLSKVKQCCKLQKELKINFVSPQEIAPYIALSKIDGALMLDTNLKCYAISCILDGVAETPGDLSRGSRYNSASVYINSKEDPFYAVILSEDGGIEILYNKAANL